MPAVCAAWSARAAVSKIRTVASHGRTRREVSLPGSAAACVLARRPVFLACVLTAAAFEIRALSTPARMVLENTLASGPTTGMWGLLFLASVLVAWCFAQRYYREESRLQVEHDALMLCSTVGMMLMAGAQDLLVFFVGLELLSELQRSGGKGNVVDVVENLRSQIVATNKRIRTVDAMSPAGRQRKESYDAVAQTRTIVAGFKNRFKRHEIECEVTVDGQPADKWSLEVFMVKGLIAQVLENLLTNSVYWLQQGVRAGEKQRRIEIEIDSKTLTMFISDNGPGIEPRYAKEIFRPYYSTRKKGKGLGLYIASELVAYHEGKLYLDPSTDKDGRLRTFVLELPKETG